MNKKIIELSAFKNAKAYVFPISTTKSFKELYNNISAGDLPIRGDGTMLDIIKKNLDNDSWSFKDNCWTLEWDTGKCLMKANSFRKPYRKYYRMADE